MKNHFFQLTALMSLTLLTWYKISLQTPTGEGFSYFASFRLSDITFPFISYDTGARIIYEFFKILFKDNLQLFQVLILIFFLSLVAIFYWFVYRITNSKMISFISSLFFALNFNGNYEMIGIGNYQFFTQRAFWFLLLFPSFVFFSKYLKTRKEKHFIISFVFYFFSLYFTQFSIFFLPIFLTYFLAFQFTKKNKLKDFLLIGFRLLLYFFVTFVVLYIDSSYASFSPIKGNNFFSFLLNSQGLIIKQFLRQISVLLFPEEVVRFFSSLRNTSLEDTIGFLGFPAVFLYFCLTACLIKKEKKLASLVIGISLFIPINLVLNSFMRSDIVGFMHSGSRYLFVPTIGISILWSILLSSLIASRKIQIKIFVIFLIVLFIYSQITSVWKNMNEYSYTYESIKVSLSYIKKISIEINEDSFVIVPSVLGYHGANFAKEFYGKKNNIFLPYQASWHKQIKRSFDPKKDYILEYDKQTEKVVDLTKKYHEVIAKKQKEDP